MDDHRVHVVDPDDARAQQRLRMVAEVAARARRRARGGTVRPWGALR